MIKFLGLANIIFISLGLVILARKDRAFSFLKYPITSIADKRENRPWFIALLSIFALLQMGFSLIFVNAFEPLHKEVLNSVFLSGGILLFLSAITTYYWPRVHRYFSWATVIIVSIGIILLSKATFKIFPNVTILLITITVVCCLLTQYLRIAKKAGYWEVPLLLLVVFWNGAASYMLLIKK
jgi:hypothetical protein